MAYTIKTRQEFKQEIKQYLKENPIEESYEKSLIEDFESKDLTDLYKLFLNLKGKKLDDDLLIKLKNIVGQDYSLNVNIIFPDEEASNIISNRNIEEITNIIKNKFLEMMQDNKEDINKEELYKMATIVNKVYPETFLKLIKTPKSNIKKDQEIVKERIMKTIEHWHSHNSERALEENRDILGALYISASKLYPEMGIYVPGRTKSMKSSVANINKEAYGSLANIIPENMEEGISTDEVDKKFQMDKANTDFSGFTIVLGNTDDTMHFDKSDPKTSELLELRKIRDKNMKFLHSMENFLIEHDNDVFSKQELHQIKMELLMRLRELTYEECRKEYKGTSFTEMLKENLGKEYDLDDYDVNEGEYLMKLDELYELLDEMKKRIHDKYQAKILEISVPEILNDELLSDELHVKSRFIKKVIKENGFCANYYELTTIDGRKIELQAITKMRFKESKDGSSDHSKLPNKEIKITQFFEPSSKECDEQEFIKMMTLLNNTPIAKKNSLYITPDQELSPMEKRLKRRLKVAEQNVKLKDSFEDTHIFPDGSEQKCKYSLDEYLKNFAEYVSPKLMSVSSHHTRFHKGVAGYNKKSIISAFTEVLLKHDSTSCLAQILIDRLEEIVPNDKNEISRNGIIKRANKRYINSGENRDDEDDITR